MRLAAVLLLSVLLIAGCGGGSKTPDEVLACLQEKGRDVELDDRGHIPDAPIAVITGAGDTAVLFFADSDEAETGAGLQRREFPMAEADKVQRHGEIVVIAQDGEPDPAVEDCV